MPTTPRTYTREELTLLVEGSVKTAVKNRTGRDISLLDNLSIKYPDAVALGELLGDIQDILLRDHKIPDRLTNPSAADKKSILQGDYAGLVGWIYTRLAKTHLKKDQETAV